MDKKLKNTRAVDRRIEKTRKAIHKAYLEYITEKNSSRITVSELARRANIDRKTFYLHYTSPDEVLVEYIEEKFSRIVSSMEENRYFDDPFNVEKLIDLLDKFYQEEKQLLISSAENDSLDDLWRCAHNILSDKVIELYAPLMNIDDEKLRMYFDFFGSGVIEIYRRWVRGEYSFDLRSLIEMAGYATRAGIYPFISNKSDENIH